ncbi:PREDICTED: vanin-like protein 2 [Drosophila arizonae]|uniref:Vanin-like protein 2 n=1 Tax=Drosophila arizonae TaxID=7263 RepID=A0ABM1PSF8_DROAR|nr:PREDICTED: vanin-like protein 2 [Drosophila arizonae]
MYSHGVRLFCLAMCLPLRLSLATDNSYYSAGVVEYADETGTSKERVTKATAGFVTLIESNDASDLDILVFPEHVLNNGDYATFVPDPEEKITPCFSPDYELFFVEISCATRARNIYVVINVVEKELCGKDYGSDALNPCPASGVRLFNTNVVLDRRGRVISRYRKTHLWRREYYSMAVMRQPDLITFETDFGVTFGHFICFDMLFYEPAMRLIFEQNITDIIYPTYWFSELPFLSALQLQEGWAFANNVNLLAADGSNPGKRTTGSGIYAGRSGRQVAAIYQQPTVQLLKARLPKRSLGGVADPEVLPAFQPQSTTARHTGLLTYRDYNLDVFRTALLPADFVNESQRLCHGSFCCNFQVERRPIPSAAEYAAYRYRLAAYFSNETTFILVDRSEQAVCAVFACLDEELASCGRIFPDHIEVANRYYFEHIRIEAVFPAARRRLIMPSTLDGSMRPLPVLQFNWTEMPSAQLLSETQVQLELLQPKNDLLTFGIWANYYSQVPTTHNLDHLQPIVLNARSSSVAIESTSSFCLLLLALILQLR